MSVILSQTWMFRWKHFPESAFYKKAPRRYAYYGIVLYIMHILGMFLFLHST